MSSINLQTPIIYPCVVFFSIRIVTIIFLGMLSASWNAYHLALKQCFLVCQDNYFAVLWKDLSASFIKFSCLTFQTHWNMAWDWQFHTFSHCPDKLRNTENWINSNQLLSLQFTWILENNEQSLESTVCFLSITAEAVKWTDVTIWRDDGPSRP